MKIEITKRPHTDIYKISVFTWDPHDDEKHVLDFVKTTFSKKELLEEVSSLVDSELNAGVIRP